MEVVGVDGGEVKVGDDANAKDEEELLRLLWVKQKVSASSRVRANACHRSSNNNRQCKGSILQRMKVVAYELIISK